MMNLKSVQMSWPIVIAGLFVLSLVVIALGAWYVLAVPGHTHRGPLPAMTAEESDVATRLKEHVETIASAPHNVQHFPALEAAAKYIEHTLGELGYSLDQQSFSVESRAVRNIDASRASKHLAASVPVLIVGAHYDSFNNAPGANDNATGTATVLELARLLKNLQEERIRLRFVLFVNEEPPYYRTPDMGSWQYAKRVSQRGEQIYGMISLETLGAFSDKPGSQTYPPPFGLVFPSTANFIAFVGLPGGRGLLHEVLGSFRRHTAFPTIGGVAPDVVPGVGWSDHWAFHEHGFPAIMITDTALYRYQHYHLPSDTPDKVDYAKLARITKGLERVIREMAGGSTTVQL
jgi:Peptidase family M28